MCGILLQMQNAALLLVIWGMPDQDQEFRLKTIRLLGC